MTLSWLTDALATLGVGKYTKAPGTFGSLIAVLIWWAASPKTIVLQLVMIFSAAVVAFFVIHFYEERHQSHDAQEIVIDELVGMWLTLFTSPPQYNYIVWGFVFFRLFDIWKPFPVSYFDQKVKGASGTLMDDVMAGVFAWSALQILIFIGRYFGFAFA